MINLPSAVAATIVAAALSAASVAAQTRGNLPPARSTPQPPPAPPANADRVRPTQSPLPDDYSLQPGDKLRIEVYKDAQLSQSVQVRPDGKITMPLIGDIAAMGLTPIELRDTITKSLKEYVNNPVVTVIVVEATAAIAFVTGEVNHPGSVALQGGPLSVLQALAL